MNKLVKGVLYFSFFAVVLVVATMSYFFVQHKEANSKFVLISGHLTKLLHTNEQLRQHAEKIVVYKQFGLKEPEQEKLKKHHKQLLVQKDTLDVLLKDIAGKVVNDSSFILQSEVLSRAINVSGSALTIMGNLSPSDFEWKEKEDLSINELKVTLPLISTYIFSFQQQIADQSLLFEEQQSIRQSSLLIVLFLFVVLVGVFVLRPLIARSELLQSEKESLTREKKESLDKLDKLSLRLEECDEALVLARNNNTIINKSLEEKNKEIKAFRADFEYFTYIISHDLKAPLRAISSLSSWIYEDLNSSLDEEQKKYLDILKSRVQRMDDLINGILNFATAGKKGIREEKIYLNQLVSEIVLELEGKDNIYFDIQSDLPLMMTDKTSLEIVLRQLLSNAVKFNTNEKPQVVLRCEQKVDFYEISVSDNGPGIEEQYHRQIFEIFKTLDVADDKGSGVGLSIAKKIVADKGGTIWLDSNKRKGTTFYFTWPS